MIKGLITLALAATAAAAPIAAQDRDLILEYTVTLSEPVPTQDVTDLLGEGNAVGYAPPPENATITMGSDNMTETHVPTSTSTEEPTSTETEEAAPASSSSNATEPVAAVVPVNICTNNGTHCLTTMGSEFANTKLSWDQIAQFNLGLDGLLVRLDDLSCVDAVPMDENSWYDIKYVNCTLPVYLQGALAMKDNGIGAEETTSTEAPTETEAEGRRRDAEPDVERHTIWFYNTTSSYLCANVNDGLNDMKMVCLYSDEGYAMLGTVEDLEDVEEKNREIAMPMAVADNMTLSDRLSQMLLAMTYDGSVFWAASWDTNIQGVMKYKFGNAQTEELDMGEVNNIVYPLWQVINDCRQQCDTHAWCRSFSFPIFDRVCRLSDALPIIKAEDVDPKNPDVVTFVQNKNYNRTDYILTENEDGAEESSATTTVKLEPTTVTSA